MAGIANTTLAVYGLFVPVEDIPKPISSAVVFTVEHKPSIAIHIYQIFLPPLTCEGLLFAMVDDNGDLEGAHMARRATFILSMDTPMFTRLGRDLNHPGL